MRAFYPPLDSPLQPASLFPTKISASAGATLAAVEPGPHLGAEREQADRADDGHEASINGALEAWQVRQSDGGPADIGFFKSPLSA